MRYEPVREIITCMSCGQTKQCHTSKYNRPLCLNIWNNTINCSICDDCIGEIPRGLYNWMWWFLGASFLLVVFGIYYLCADISPDILIGILIVFAGWLLGAIGASGGLMKLYGENTGKMLGIFFGWTHIPTIILLTASRKIKRTVLLEMRLGEIAKRILNEEDKENRELVQRAAEISSKSAEKLTKEEKELLAEKLHYDKRVQIANEDRRVVKRDEILSRTKRGVAFTIVMALLGLLMYNGEGYIVFFDLKLSLGVFLGFLGACWVLDVASILDVHKQIKYIPVSNTAAYFENSGKAPLSENTKL